MIGPGAQGHELGLTRYDQIDPQGVLQLAETAQGREIARDASLAGRMNQPTRGASAPIAPRVNPDSLPWPGAGLGCVL